MTKPQTHQIVNEAALLSLGQAARAQVKDILAAAEKSLDGPCRMYAAQTPDTKIYFAASRVEAGNGSSRTKPPIDDRIPDIVLSSLDLSTGTPSGATFQVEGQTLALPTAVGFPTDPFIRFAFSLRTSGEINIKYSAQAASVGALTAPGDLFAAIDGDPIGWLDLEYATSSTLKTAGSATTIIENKVSTTPRVFNIASGGGSGGGSDRTFKIVSFSATGCTLKGGYGAIDDGRVLATYDGAGAASTDYGKDLTVSLNDILTASGLAALGTINSASAKLLALVVDLQSLASEVSLTDNKRKVFDITEDQLRLLDEEDLTQINPTRYVLLDQIYLPITVTSWVTAVGIVKPTRVHDSVTSFFQYIERYQSPQQTTVSASIPLTHGLTGEPQIVQVFYFDGSTTIDVTQDSLVDKTPTQVLISTSALTFGSGEYAYVEALYFPTIPNLASAQRQFRSDWYTSTATTTVAHGLSDMDDIAGYQVQEWDTTTGKRRVYVTNALVVNFDGTNFYLDWTGISPSATLRYRVIAGGSPLPWSIPTSEVYDVTFTAEPSWPIAHGLTALPTYLAAFQEVATDEWQPITLTGHVTATSSQLLGSLASFSPGASPARVRLIASINR